MHSGRLTLRMVLILGLALAIARSVAAAVGGVVPAESPRDRAKRQLAIRSATRQALDNIRRLGVADQAETVALTDELAKWMTQDVSRHRMRRDSRGACAARIQDERWGAFYAGLSNAVAAAQSSTPLPITVRDVLDQLGPEWKAQVGQALAVFTAASFDPLFEQARTRSVALQKHDVEQRLRYPAGKDLDARLMELYGPSRRPADRLDDREFEKLKKWLRACAGKQEGTVFEEIDAQIERVTDGMLAEIRRQYRAQLRMLDDAVASNRVPAGLITAEAIDSGLRVEMKGPLQTEQRQRPKGEMPLYDLFQPVASNVWATASDLERARWSSFIDSNAVIHISAAEVERDVNADRPEHRRPRESEDRFARALAERSRGPVAAEYVATSTLAPSDRPRWTMYFEALLAGDGEPAHRYRERVGREIAAVLPGVRAAMADQQFHSLFGPLAERRILDEAVISKILDEGSESVQTVPDVVAAFQSDKTLRLPDLSKTVLLEETETLVVEAANQQLRLGLDALKEQMRQVRALETEKIEQLKKSVDDGRPVASITREWAKELDRRWREKAAQTQSPYEPLFTRTSDLLNKTVRQLYDARKQDLATDKKQRAEDVASPEEPANEAAVVHPTKQPLSRERIAVEDRRKAEDAPKDAKDSGLGGVSKKAKGYADGVLIYADASNRLCEVTLLSPTEEILAVVPFESEAADQAATVVYEGLREAIEKMLTDRQAAGQVERMGFFSLWRKSSPELKLLVLVPSSQVRHRMNIELRRKIRDQVEQWSAAHRSGERAIRLRWEESL